MASPEGTHQHAQLSCGCILNIGGNVCTWHLSAGCHVPRLPVTSVTRQIVDLQAGTNFPIWTETWVMYDLRGARLCPAHPLHASRCSRRCHHAFFLSDMLECCRIIPSSFQLCCDHATGLGCIQSGPGSCSVSQLPEPSGSAPRYHDTLQLQASSQAFGYLSTSNFPDLVSGNMTPCHGNLGPITVMDSTSGTDS